MKSTVLLSALFLLVAFASTSQLSKIPFTPSLLDSSQFVDHNFFCLEYDESNEQARWTHYLMTRKMTKSVADRTDRFLEDPNVKTGSATDADYKASGFDRGHLVPAGDMAFSEESMSASFYYSNMSPQVPAFNRGIWKKLETLVRYWAFTYDSMYVVSGPLFKDSVTYIGPNKVGVPAAYFKSVFVKTAGRTQMIGFIIPNEASDKDLMHYMVSVDEIENQSGIDLYQGLDLNLQKRLEPIVMKKLWIWKPGEINHPIETDPIQCSGITKTGNRCSRKTTDPSGFCYQHKKE